MAIVGEPCIVDAHIGSPNNLLQKELLIRTLYTHIIEEGERNQEKRRIPWAVIYLYFHTIRTQKKRNIKTLVPKLSILNVGTVPTFAF